MRTQDEASNRGRRLYEERSAWSINDLFLNWLRHLASLHTRLKDAWWGCLLSESNWKSTKASKSLEGRETRKYRGRPFCHEQRKSHPFFSSSSPSLVPRLISWGSWFSKQFQLTGSLNMKYFEFASICSQLCSIRLCIRGCFHLSSMISVWGHLVESLRLIECFILVLKMYRSSFFLLHLNLIGISSFAHPQASTSGRGLEWRWGGAPSSFPLLFCGWVGRREKEARVC